MRTLANVLWRAWIVTSNRASNLEHYGFGGRAWTGQ